MAGAKIHSFPSGAVQAPRAELLIVAQIHKQTYDASDAARLNHKE